MDNEKFADILKAEREAHDRYERETIVSGFSIAELRLAFERVQDKENWKLPVRALVAPADLYKTCVAIEFFNGSVARARLTKGGLFLVNALGYYEAVGA